MERRLKLTPSPAHSWLLAVVVAGGCQGPVGGSHSVDIHDPQPKSVEHSQNTHEHEHGHAEHEHGHAEHEHGHAEHDAQTVHLSGHQRQAVGLTVTEAGPGTLQRRLTLRGEVKLNRDRIAHVAPLVGGIIRNVQRSLGDRVEQGEVLATLESRELGERMAALLAASKRLELREIRYKREQELWQQKVSPQQDYLDAKQDLLEGRIEYDAALLNLRALGMAKSELTRIQRRTRGDALGRLQLRAPSAGTIVEKHAVAGEVADGDSELFVIADLSTVWVDLRVYQQDLEVLRHGTVLELTGDGLSGSVQGKVHFISPLIDRETRTATARVELDNSDGRLRPGLFVTARSHASQFQRNIVVPLNALVSIDNEEIIFIATGDAFKATRITRGMSDGRQVEIVAGLKPGQRYVSQGAFELKAKLVTSNMDPHAGHGH